MSKNTSRPSSQSTNEKLSYFRARLMAQLLVIFISLTLAGFRISYVFKDTEVSPVAITTLAITIPFLVALSLIVIIKFLLYRRIRARILKYSDFIDILFSLVFTIEWILSVRQLFHSLEDAQGHYSIAYIRPTIMILGSFSWRVVLLIIITQQWQVRIIGPVVVLIYILQATIKLDHNDTLYIVIWAVLQMLYVILIFYFEHKMNFILTIGSIQQQQWLQLNEFILNNIPENIAIIDLKGNCKSVNDNFKKLIRHRTQSTEIKPFLRYIKNIEQQEEYDMESDTESHIDLNPLGPINPVQIRKERRFDPQDLESLESLINVFGTWITKDFVKERSPYIFSSKFRQDDDENTQERSFQIHISFINQQPQKYILLILKDTTQRDLVLTLEGDMKYKDHLLASVSHELRTPLNGNINMIEAALRSKDINDKIKETLLQPAVKSSKFLLYLVNDILDLYQIKAQKLRLVFQQSSLKETLTNTVQLLELHAKKKGIELQTNIDQTIPDTFCTDHARLSQIILNLMNNSIKFTQNGYVKLSAWPLFGTHNVNISIQDSGVGMTQEDVGKLFKDFTHIERKDHEKINPTGVGLGLKIANDLAKLLGPTDNTGIQVESTLDRGSTFSFVIENKETGLESQRNLESKEDPSPLVPNEFNIATEASLEVKIAHFNSLRSLPILVAGTQTLPTLASSCSCPQILAVDDDSFNVMAYEVILNSLGVQYECAFNGKSAIDKMLNKVRYPCSLNCHPYRVVFMDEEMPGMTGRETVAEISRLQNQGLLPQMKIIGCTAHHDKGKIEEFLKSGIAEFVSKPISFDTIKKILDKYDVV